MEKIQKNIQKIQNIFRKYILKYRKNIENIEGAEKVTENGILAYFTFLKLSDVNFPQPWN